MWQSQYYIPPPIPVQQQRNNIGQQERNNIGQHERNIIGQHIEKDN